MSWQQSRSKRSTGKILATECSSSPALRVPSRPEESPADSDARATGRGAGLRTPADGLSLPFSALAEQLTASFRDLAQMHVVHLQEESQGWFQTAAPPPPPERFRSTRLVLIAGMDWSSANLVQSVACFVHLGVWKWNDC